MNEEERKWLEEFNKSEKKQTSYSGRRCYSEFANPDEDPGSRFNVDKIYEIGGERLVVLYLCGCNYKLAAKELKIKEFTLRRHILRLRSRLQIEGITKERLREYLFNEALTSI